ncbi:uncharacterized protein LOC123723556 [Papilio machaon]|uniref:uncharacterized protein LOC123723556 n=1 Tax=Papilio machaon TaxID=76193 RepID=UPI001E665801|nr:uncharacterized protein LOC123723556 [Papilio machaon]
MAPSVSILQANVNHCVAAQDLLIQTAAQWKIDVVIDAEPYYVRARDDWAGDRDDSVAIVAWRRTGPTPFKSITKGRGWVLASLGGIAVIGVYFAPSRSFADFERICSPKSALLWPMHTPPLLWTPETSTPNRVRGRRAWASQAGDTAEHTLNAPHSLAQ